MLKNYLIVDIETTGLDPQKNKIIEIGAIKVKAGQEPECFSQIINPQVPIPEYITELVGITDGMVQDAPELSEVMKAFLEFAEDLPLLGHNLKFDYSFLKTAAVQCGYSFERNGLDTLAIARKYLKELESRKLDALCKHFGIQDDNHHRAWNDVQVTKELYEILCDRFEGKEGSDAKDFEPSQMQFAVKKESPITPRQESFLRSLLMQHGIQPDYDIAALSKSEASKKIDGIINQFGRY